MQEGSYGGWEHVDADYIYSAIPKHASQNKICSQPGPTPRTCQSNFSMPSLMANAYCHVNQAGSTSVKNVDHRTTMWHPAQRLTRKAAG